MKRSLPLTIILSLVFITHLFSQLPDGTVAPDFTLQDIDGNTFNLYNDGVNQGKYVVLDFFATWCPTCWNDFQDDVMENVHQWYGDEGTCDSDVIVIGIEADLGTNSQDLHGTGSNTQGDWVSGTPYRLFDLTGSTVINAYDIVEYPTYYVICPDGFVYSQNFYSSASMVLAALDCEHNNDVNVGIVQDVDCFAMSYTPQIDFTNTNIPMLNSLAVRYRYDNGPEQLYNWSGNVAMYESDVVTLPTSTFDIGTHSLWYVVENPNGVADQNKTDNCGSPGFSIEPGGEFVELNEDFSGGALPEDWVFVNFIDDLEWRYSEVNGGSLLLPGYEYFETQDYPIYGWSPQVDLSNVTSAFLQFDYAYANYPGFEDGFTLEVRSNCLDQMIFEEYGIDLATAPPTTNSFVPTEDDWATFCFDLTPFLGLRVSFWFEGIYDFGNNLYIDNFRVTTSNCALAAEEITTRPTIQIYPNPANDLFYIEMDNHSSRMLSCRLLDSRGSMIMNLDPKKLNSGINPVDIQSLTSGLYLIECVFADYTVTQKVLVD